MKAGKLKCVFYPIDRAIAAYGDDIKPQRTIKFLGVKVMVGGRYNFHLLGRRDAFKGAAINIGLAIPYFNDDQNGLVAHDQVQFPLFAAIISTYKFESLVKQKIKGLVFSAFAA